MKRRKILLLIIILSSICALFIIYYFYSFNQKMEMAIQERIEYPSINNSTYIGDIIITKKMSKLSTNRGTYLVEMINDRKLSSAGITRNFDYFPADFMSFIQIGDSISKRAYSDSIFVYRKQNVYYFILGEVINKKH